MSLLIYGANGYTGELCARRAAAEGLPAVLAGRRADAVRALAVELGRPHLAFALDRPAAVDAALTGVTVVLNCAGPFSRTAAQLVAACLRAKVHYLDITGELAVLEGIAGRDDEARAAGITLLPGAGFDVVPSDCLAAHVKRRLPSATHLTLAFRAGARMSRGTATTAVENAGGGGMIRRDGVLRPVPSGWRTRAVDFGSGPVQAITIPGRRRHGVPHDRDPEHRGLCGSADSRPHRVAPGPRGRPVAGVRSRSTTLEGARR